MRVHNQISGLETDTRVITHIQTARLRIVEKLTTFDRSLDSPSHAETSEISNKRCRDSVGCCEAADMRTVVEMRVEFQKWIVLLLCERRLRTFNGVDSGDVADEWAPGGVVADKF